MNNTKNIPISITSKTCWIEAKWRSPLARPSVPKIHLYYILALSKKLSLVLQKGTKTNN